jgi:hypothetical protein
MIKGTASAKRKRLLLEVAASKKRVESKSSSLRLLRVPDGSGSKSKIFVGQEAEVT